MAIVMNICEYSSDGFDTEVNSLSVAILGSMNSSLEFILGI